LVGGGRLNDGRVSGTNCARPTRSRKSLEENANVHAFGGIDSRAERPVVPKGLLGVVKAIADTGFLVAFANRNDQYHDWALEVARRIVEPLLTCEAVLAESAFHLRSSAVVLDMLNEDLVTLAFDCAKHVERLRALAKRYADRKPDLADLCLIRMSEMNPRHSVITVDRGDFRVYRRNKREIIPLICPPES